MFTFVACDDPTKPSPAELTGSVSISSAQVGTPVTVNVINLEGTGTISYQWEIGTGSFSIRADSSAPGIGDGTGTGGFTAISGATGASYTPVNTDVGKYLRVTVRREGYAGTKTSDAVVVQSAGTDPPTVSAVTVSSASPSVAKGGSVQFSATVTGTNNPSQTVVWTIDTSGKAAGTTINSAGLLTVAADETQAALIVRATSTLDTSKSGTASVAVSGGSGNPSTVTSVTISPPTGSAAKGGSVQFSATVAGTNSPPQTVVWSIVTTGTATGTTINSTGGLTVAADETQATLIVLATSTQDTSKFGTASVAVSGGSVNPPTVTSVTISPPTGSAAKGGSVQFSATVAGTNNPSQTVIWAIDTSGKAAGTAINGAGLLTVAADETQAILIVRATSPLDTSKYGTAFVSITGGSGNLPTVISVTISPPTGNVAKGGSIPFSAVVVGTNNPVQTVTWTIDTSGKAAGTTINSAGLLTVAVDETQAALTVRATSTLDTSKYGTTFVSITDGSNPTPTTYAVTFHPNGGSPAPAPQTITQGDVATQPSAMTKAITEGLYLGSLASATPVFDGWHTDPALTAPYSFSTPVTGNLNLYAKWNSSSQDVSGQIGDNFLAKALAWIRGQNPSVSTNYTIVLGANYDIPGITDTSTTAVNYINKANAVITLAGTNRVEIGLSATGSLFFVANGELIVDNNITLNGRADNFNPLVYVKGTGLNNGGRLTLNDGGIIYGNTGLFGGGVHVDAYGTFIMNGGTISDNRASSGGGVFVAGAGASFEMHGGTVSFNTVIGTLNNGVIFSGGGGVAVSTSGSFTMSGNAAISDNTASTNGGGVFVGGSFTMQDGVISGNTAGYGGGVNIIGSGEVNKTGGTIYGSGAGGSLPNTATYGNAAHYAQYFPDTNPLPDGITYTYYYRDTTLGENDNISDSDPLPANSGDTLGNWTKK